MIYDLLDVYCNNADGDDLVLANYQPKDGLYIRLHEPGKKPDILKIDKNTNRNGELWEFFKVADFYSQLVEMNKPVDPKKQIHSNNLYSVAFKAGTLTVGARAEESFRESILRYFTALMSPKKEDEKILESYAFPAIDKEVILRNQDYALSQLDYIKEQIAAEKIKETAYVKIYFAASQDDYEREGKRYLIPKIFNKNDFNVTIDNVVYGLSNSNMGMNAKKPFLEHKTTQFKVPFRVNVEDALETKNMFTWLDGQKDDGKSIAAGYLPIERSNIFQMEKCISKRESAHFVHIERGIRPIIDEYDFLPGITDQLEPALDLENFLGLDDFKPERIIEKSRLEQIFDALLFGRNLIRNYYSKDIKPNNWFSTTQINLLIRYRDALHAYFRKGDSSGFLQCIDNLSQVMIREMLRREIFKRLDCTLAAKAMNLRLSICKYFLEKREKSEMGSQIQSLSKALEAQFGKNETTGKEKQEDIFCANDQEFFYYTGQLVSYLLSKSQAYNPTYQLINPIMEAKTIGKLKKEIIKLQTKYSHAVGPKSTRYKRLCGAVMGYQCEQEEILFDFFLAGLMTKNIIYFKEQKETKGETEHEIIK
jgi:CRISPR-associated protein Csh1